jgi:hypothetical protein
MIYKTFEQWKSGNVLEHGVSRTEHYSEDQLDLVEMGWMYGYDAGRAVEQALDKKAENARELGLDYEPADGTQVSKVWWDGEKLMAKPIPLEDIYQPVQDSTCNETLRAQDKAYPRTCKKCGKGPCIGAPKQPPAQPAPVQEPLATLFGSLPVYDTPPAAAVPDAIHHTDLSEHPQYIEGWNDCRQAMLEMMK